jgi:hypothetical protein
MIPTMACLICNRLVATGGVCPSCASPEDEEFNRVEMESRIKQEYIRAMRKTTREEKISRPAVYEVPANNRMIASHQDHVRRLMDELAIARVCIRELGDRLSRLEKPWVDLTKEECFELCVKHKDNSFSLLVAVQEKLMEKNTP